MEIGPDLFPLLFEAADAIADAGKRLREKEALEAAPVARLLPRLRAAAHGGALAGTSPNAGAPRSAPLIVTRASFSASAKVDEDTAGPDTGPVPKVGGAPGVAGGVATVAPC